MARAKTLLDASAARQPDPAEILAEVNRGLVRENEAGMYVTAVCGVLEVATGELAFACAGHEPPIHLRGDGPPVPFAAEGGTILGLLDAPPPFPLNRVRLAPGEGLVAYTDGIGEAFDAEQTLFGLERLLAALEPVAHASAAGVTERVRDEVRAFAGAASQSDDITILTLRWLRRP
jgi:sigma-B regulation protein RsbU (phosphoserine phosphatase)